MKVTRDTATDEEKANFLMANARAQRALDHAILVLAEMPSLVPFEERAQVALEKARATAERAELEAEFVAFMSENGEIEPPDAQTVADVEAAADSLDNMTANAAALVGIVHGLTTLINAYKGAPAATARTFGVRAIARPAAPKKKRKKK